MEVTATTAFTSAKLETITPKDAQRMLGKMGVNRQLRINVWRKYQNDMEHDNWTFSAQPIIVAPNGEVLDGQHRLRAIVASNRSQKFLVVRGVAAEAKQSIDLNAPRTHSDILAIQGHTNTNVLASLTKWAHAWRTNPTTGWRTYRPWSAADCIEALSVHPEYIEIGLRARRNANHSGGLLPPSGFAIISYVLSCTGCAEEEWEFSDTLGSGANIDELSPIFQLRKTLVKIRTGRVVVPYDTRDITAMAIRSWNHWIAGTSPRRIPMLITDRDYPVTRLP